MLKKSEWMLLYLWKLTAFTAYRLSNEVRPIHYTLKLHPDMTKNTFQGEVSIIVRTENVLEKIVLHSKGLNITEVLANQLPARISKERHEKISVSYEHGGFQPGEHLLYFKYNGVFYERYGLIKASYKYNNHTGYLVVNEFEPKGARKAFPCFDEPSFKAKFNIRLVTPNDSYIAVSNMPEIARYPTSNGVIYDFATSVKMSTYLVSLAITDYNFYEEIFHYGHKKIPIRVYTYNASRENNKHAIDAAKAAIGFYSNYSGIDYPLPKLDMIEYDKAKIAATETWGLIQFKEGLLTTSLGIYDVGQCNLVIFHELAHFWFGNLVTNNWWNDLWLQEGFATYLSTGHMLHHYESKVSTRQINLLELYEIEKISGTHPLVNYFVTSEFIEKRFDKIIYSKGAFLLEALEAVVGKRVFEEVVQTFLKTFSFGTATTNDLIMAFESSNPNTNLRSFLESYIYQTGYPLVNVDDSSENYILTQSDVVNGNMEAKWTIPVSYTCGNNLTNLIWFDREANRVTINCSQNHKWILLNSVQQPGIYITNYTDTMWKNLFDHLDELPKPDVRSLAENVAVLYLSKTINCDIILQFVDKIDVSLLHLIFGIVINIVKKLACFESEFEVLLEYLNQKIAKVENWFEFFNVTCTEEENRTSNGVDSHVRECSQWISTNLVNFIKP